MPGENEQVDNTAEATAAEDSGTTQDANAAESSNADVEANDNQGAKDAQDEPNFADTVKEALSPGNEESSTQGEESPPSDGQEGEDADPNAEGEKSSSEEDERLDKNPRFQEVIAEKNEAVEQLEAFKPYTEILTSAKDSGLSDEDISKSIQLGNVVNQALMGKADPVEVLAILNPIITGLTDAAGMVLPDDLAEKVEKGLMTEADAQDFAKERAKNRALEASVEFDNKKREETQQEQQGRLVAENKQKRDAAMDAWEETQKSTDPDYEQKKVVLNGMIKAAIVDAMKGRETPVSPDEAVQIAEKAKQELDGMFIKGTPGAKNGHLESKNPPSSRVEKTPGTIGEAIANAVNSTKK